MRRLWIYATVFAAAPVLAQDTTERDRSYLTGLIEDALSGVGREVRIDGFRGALSSTARFDSLTVADDEGVWITVTDGTLQWDRSALLSGAIDISEITVGQVDLPRLPVAQDTGPAPAAQDFELPDLPVSLKLDSLNIRQANLGPAFLGEDVQLAIEGSAQLAGGEGQAALTMERTDGEQGTIALSGAFDNATEVLQVQLNMTEGPDGLFANAVSLPGKPAIEFIADGQGPLGDFAADIALATDGVERLGGTVRVADVPTDPTQSTSDSTEEPAPKARRFAADISGDIQPLFQADYARFFGPDTQFRVIGEQTTDGDISLSDLSITTDALQVDGRADLAASGLPRAFVLTIDMGGEGPVLLPLSGPKAYVTLARLEAHYDAAQGDEFSVDGVVSGFSRDDIAVDLAVLSASGTISELFETADYAARVSAQAGLDLIGLTHEDAALQQALGSGATLEFGARWQSGQPIRFEDLALDAGDIGVTGTAAIDGFDDNFQTTFDVRLRVNDLARLSGVAALPGLSGSGTASAVGDYAALTGAFDAQVALEAQSLRTGNAQVDALTGAQTTVALDAARDNQGTVLRALSLDSVAGAANVSGRIDATGGTFDYRAQIDNLGRIADGISGPASINGTASAASGLERWQIDADATGPGNTTAALSGNVIVSPSLVLDLSAAGTAPLALANNYLSEMSIQGTARYDLTIAGAPSLNAVTGTIETSGARLAQASLGQSLTEIDATVQIANGAAQTTLSAKPSRGGRISANGTLGLEAPMPTDLRIDLIGARFEDGKLYSTRVDGQLNLTGPLQGGATLAGTLTLDATEIAVPSGTMSSSGSDIPEITHVGAPDAVTRSRSRAGLIDTGNGGGASRPIGLNIRIDAPNQIFVRGRGLDAELGGGLRVTGTTADVIPIGQFDLVRGRLDILGKRVELDEGSLSLRGTFNPRLYLVASTEADDATVTITLEGPADDLDVSFASSPELPDDEILARLLFGKGVTEISAVQAAQLASAVVTLAGKGGEGVVGNLRRNFGLDDLDVTTSDEGTAELRVGKYLSDNIYSDVTVDSEGNSTIELNLDITEDITARGSLGSDGTTGIGVFFEQDY